MPLRQVILSQVKETTFISEPVFSTFAYAWTKNNFTQLQWRGVMVSMLVSSTIDRGFELKSDQTKDCKISIFCFRTKTCSTNK